MKIGIYPGSFDPFTVGHLDILLRAKKIFDRVIVGVLENSAKSPAFSLDQRVDFIRRSAKEANVDCEVVRFSGLLVDFAQRCNATAIVRGLRAVTDFEYEMQMASMNKKLAPDVETIFLMTSTKHSYLSASIVRELGRWGGCIDGFVAPSILCDVREALRVQNPTENCEAKP